MDQFFLRKDKRVRPQLHHDNKRHKIHRQQIEESKIKNECPNSIYLKTSPIKNKRNPHKKNRLLHKRKTTKRWVTNKIEKSLLAEINR